MTGPMVNRQRLSREDYLALRDAGFTDEAIRNDPALDASGVPAGALPSPLVNMAREAGFTPGSTPKPEPNRGSYLGGLARTAAQGASLGFSDELRGLVQGAGAMLPGGRSPGEAYRSGRDAERERLSGFREDHPVSALAAELLGGIAVPGLGTAGMVAKNAGKVPTLARVAGQGAKVGAVSGAAYGAGSADDGLGDRLSGAALGGAAGLFLGGAVPVVARGVGAVTRRGAEKVAGSGVAGSRARDWAQGSRSAREMDSGGEYVLRKLEQDALTPDDIAQRAASARKAGISDVAMPDLAGDNVSGAMDLAATVPGRGKQIVREFGEQRAGGMREMLADAFETLSRIPRRSVKATREALTAEMREKGNAMFEPAFNAAGFVDDPRLLSAIEDVEQISPRFRNRALELSRIWKNKPEQMISDARVPPEIVANQLLGAAQRGTGEAIEQASMDAIESAAGARAIPSLRYAHYLKGAIDEAIDQAQRQKQTQRVAGLTIRKNALRDAAVAVSPTDASGLSMYGEALKQYAGDAEVLRALSLGERVLHENISPEALVDAVTRMTPGEEQAFRIAGLASMRDYLSERASMAPAITNAWWNKPSMQSKMQLLLGGPEETESFLQAANLTRRKAMTTAAGAGSQTAARAEGARELGEVGGMSPNEWATTAGGSTTGIRNALFRRGQSALMGSRLEAAAPYLTATGGDLDRRLLELGLLSTRASRDAASRARMMGLPSGQSAAMLTSGGNR